MQSAMRPAVRHPNQIYKQKFMKNADAKLQAPQCLSSVSWEPSFMHYVAILSYA